METKRKCRHCGKPIWLTGRNVWVTDQKSIPPPKCTRSATGLHQPHGQ